MKPFYRNIAKTIKQSCQVFLAKFCSKENPVYADLRKTVLGEPQQPESSRALAMFRCEPENVGIGYEKAFVMEILNQEKTSIPNQDTI